MTAVDQTAVPRAGPVSGRLVAAAAFALPPLMLLAVGLGFALRGGGVAPEQWQPAAIGLAASAFVLAAVGAVPRVHRSALPFLIALAALVLWSAASMIWTVSREATFEHVLRVAMLAGAAGVGLVYASRPRAALSLAAGLAIFGAVAAGVVEAKLLAGDADAFAGSRLSWPINYAPADAALVWLPLPALVAFAAAHPLRPVVRGAFAFAAALALAVGFASQSRGAAIALTGALLATLLVTRDRGRHSLTLLAVVVPVAVIVPQLIGDAAPSAELVRERGQAALFAAIVAGAIVCALSMADRRGRFPFGGREAWVGLALWTAVIVVAGWAFVSTSGGPDAWVSSRWDEFTNVDATVAASPSDAAHFGTGASNRYDYWRVAWHTFQDDPIQGVGAGAFSVPWFKSRSIDENVTDAHSWEAAALAETGFVGFALAAFVLLFPLARLRSARKGSGTWPIAAVALGGAAVYFVLHASVDWLFRIPAVAIPGFVVLGALASGGDEHGGPVFGDRGQRALLALAALAALAVAVPTYLATTGVADAESNAATSTPAALSDLDRAERLNPFAAEPLLVRALVLKADGRARAALAAAEDATERAPQSWTAWLLLADGRRLTGNAQGSRAALARAAALNPRAIRQLGLSQ
jgi:hypothetical protein